MIDFSDLSSKTVVITGASGFLGRKLVDAFLTLGSEVVAIDRDMVDLESLATEKENSELLECILCDLSSEQERAELIHHLLERDKIHVLINNAAYVGTSKVAGWATEFSFQTNVAWRNALEVNLTAIFHLTRDLQHKLASTKGSVINLGSIYASLGPDWSLYEGTDMANPAAYAASKGGLIQLTKWLATTCRDFRVNAVSPGGIYREQPASFVTKFEARTPLGRMATEDDIVGPIVFLASDISDYITGQNLVVDGGWSCW